jgi:DNA-binding transcriptional LysR family regulator
VVSRRNAAGVIRLTCPEPLVNRLTRSGLLDRFHALHPGLHVEFVMSDKYIDLRTGEADVALRSGDTDDNVLVGRKVGDSLWAVYASTDYVAAQRNARVRAGACRPPAGRRSKRTWPAIARASGCARWHRPRPWWRATTACSACCCR